MNRSFTVAGLVLLGLAAAGAGFSCKSGDSKGPASSARAAACNDAAGAMPGPCGGPGQPCCASNVCDGGGCCVPVTGGGNARVCIAAGQECVGGGATGTCNGGSCAAAGGAACGATGQPCCGGMIGDAGVLTGGFCSGDGARCTTGMCVACGNDGQVCCQGAGQQRLRVRPAVSGRADGPARHLRQVRRPQPGVLRGRP